MTYPPSLPEHVRARAFRAPNGELGILPSDVSSFLAACRSDNIEVLGWELWIIDHVWGAKSPEAATGSWSGGVPVIGQTTPAVFSGNGDIDEVEQQLSKLALSSEIPPNWLPYVRVNVTLG